MPNSEQAGQVKSSLLDIQKSLSDKVTSTDPSIIAEVDVWDRAEGGGGKTIAFCKGEIIEKGGLIFLMFQEPNYPRLPPKIDLI